MTMITRRTLVGTGTALAAAGALTGPALLDWAKVWAQAAPWILSGLFRSADRALRSKMAK
jgi:hypothetical protein